MPGRPMSRGRRRARWPCRPRRARRRPSLATRRPRGRRARAARERLADVGVVVDDEDARGRRSALTCGAPAPRRARPAARVAVRRRAGVTTNSLPRPSPSLWAATRRRRAARTSRLTSVRPMPRPPCGAVERAARPARTGRRRAAASPGAMPMPLSRTRTTDLVAVARDRRALMCPPGSVYLAALFSRLATTCVRRVGVGRRPRSAPSGSATIELVVARVDQRPRRSRTRLARRRRAASIALACAARSCRW